eukprot:m.131326 g.131326  ORF g.131326 m.131326 type:complete len:497 (-) comp16812_c1_seq2:7-1497(-)
MPFPEPAQMLVSHVQMVPEAAATEYMGARGKRVCRRNKRSEKPTYAAIIAVVIHASQAKRLKLQDIYDAVSTFSDVIPPSVSPDTWKNSIRHNLSLKQCFRKIMAVEEGREEDAVAGEAGKRRNPSAWWTLDYAQLPAAAWRAIEEYDRTGTVTWPGKSTIGNGCMLRGGGSVAAASAAAADATSRAAAAAAAATVAAAAASATTSSSASGSGDAPKPLAMPGNPSATMVHPITAASRLVAEKLAGAAAKQYSSVPHKQQQGGGLATAAVGSTTDLRSLQQLHLHQQQHHQQQQQHLLRLHHGEQPKQEAKQQNTQLQRQHAQPQLHAQQPQLHAQPQLQPFSWQPFLLLQQQLQRQLQLSVASAALNAAAIKNEGVERMAGVQTQGTAARPAPLGSGNGTAGTEHNNEHDDGYRGSEPVSPVASVSSLSTPASSPDKTARLSPASKPVAAGLDQHGLGAHAAKPFRRSDSSASETDSLLDTLATVATMLRGQMPA